MALPPSRDACTCRHLPHPRKGPGKVGLDVVDVLETHRDPDEVGAHPRRNLLGVGELLMGRARRVNHQCLRIAHIGQMGSQFDPVDELPTRHGAAANAEGEHATKSVPEILCGTLMRRVVFETRVGDPAHVRVFVQPPSKLEGVVRLPLHSQRKGFEPLEEEECVERALAGPEIPQAFDPRPNGKRDVSERPIRAKGVGEDQPVVAGRWLGERGELPVSPVETPRVDDHAANRGPVATDPFCRRLDNDVSAMLDRPTEIATTAKGVINHQRDPVLVGKIRQATKIGDQETRVGDRLDVQCPGVLSNRRRKGRGVVALDKGDVDSEAWQRDLELVVRSAIEVGSGDNVVAGLAEVVSARN